MSTYYLPAYPGTPTKRGNVGPAVELLQEILACAGLACDVDGDFGPQTEAAVRAVQARAGLPADGVAGVETWAALVAPYKSACAVPDGPPPATYAEAVALVAERLAALGIREIKVRGVGNSGPWVRLMMDGRDGKDGGYDQAWCAGFVRHVLRVATEWTGQAAPVPVSPSCDVTAANAGKVGRLRKNPPAAARGDLTLRRGERPGDWVHIEVVTGLLADRVKVIAGNTNDTGSREGVKVCPHVHGLAGYDVIHMGAA
jgi:peptidoglycan hydrolase-like protein with peptidoglycan-binding domain